MSVTRNVVVLSSRGSPWLPTKPVDGYLPDLWMRPDTGVATAGSRSFIAGNKTHLQIADNASLSTGDVDFTVGGWVYINSTDGGMVAGKVVGSNSQTEWILQVTNSGLILFRMYNSSGSNKQIFKTGYVTNKWYFVVGWHDSVNNELHLSVNDSEEPTVSTAGFVPQDTTAPFCIGARGSVPDTFFDGRIARVFFKKAVLTAAERTFLFNSGEGRLAGELGIAGTDGAALRDSAGGSLPSYWNLNEGNGAGNAIDSIGTNDLVPTFAELITNGGFETAGAGGADVFGTWVENAQGTSTVNDETVEVDTGAHACRFDIDASNSFASVVQTPPLTVGNTYAYSIRAKNSGSGTLAMFGVATLSLTSSYATYTGQHVATVTNLTIARGSAASASLYFDTVSVKATQIPPAAGPMESIAQDSIGTNDGVLTNMDSIGAWSSDVPAAIGSGYSLKFDGGDDVVNAGKAASLNNLTASSSTGSAWIKPLVAPGVGANYRILDKAAADGTTGWLFLLDSNRKLRVIIDHVTTDADFITTETVTISQWTHVAFTWNATAKTVKIYINGVEATYATATTGVGSLVSDSGNDFGIGSIAATPSVRCFNGYIDDPRLYNVALTAPQVAELASGNEATGATPVAHYTFDDGPQSQLISDGDPVVQWESKEGNRYQFNQITGSKRPIYVASGINGQPGIQFDGVDDLLVCASAILAGTAGTVVIVYRLTAVPNSYQTLLSSADEATLVRRIVFYGRGDTANAHINYLQSNNDTPDLLDGNTTVNASTDYVAVFQSDGSTITARLNGTAQTLNADLGANNGDWWDDTTAKDNVTIGARKLTSEDTFLSGIVCDILVYPVELTEAGRAKVASYVESRYGIAAP